MGRFHKYRTRVVDGVRYYWCPAWGDRKKAHWAPESQFYFKRMWGPKRGWYVYRLPQCKDCKRQYVYRKRSRVKPEQQYTINGNIPVRRIRPYLAELILRCGGQNRAATRLGVYPHQVCRWMGGTAHTRYIHKQNALRVMLALKEVRKEQNGSGPVPPTPWNKEYLSKVIGRSRPETRLDALGRRITQGGRKV